MRKYYWYLTSYTRKHGLVVLLSIVAAIIVFSVFIPTIVTFIEQKPRVYIGVVGQYSLTNLPRPVKQLISYGLTSIEEDGSTSPAVAERWIVEDDGKSYRFVIKQNLLWHDGSQVQPSDIEYHLRDVEVIATPNDLVFKLPDAYVPFPGTVSEPIIKWTDQKYLFFFTRRMPLGVGSYRVIDYSEKDGRLEQIVLDGPKDRLVYRFYLTEEEAVTAFKHGRIDVLSDLSKLHDIANWNTTTVTTTIRTDRYLAVFFNNAKPIFNKNIRQALSYALQKPDPSIRALGPINPTSWAYLEGGKSYDYDLERAKERILAELPPQPLTFQLTTTATFQEEAENIKRQWETFGQQAYQACQENDDIEDKNQCENVRIAITLRVSNFPDTQDYDALLIGQEIPPDPDQYSLWHSDQSTNFTHYKNTRIDALLERGRQEMDTNERLATYQEFQQFFLDDAPAVFLRYLESYEVKRK
ncbi:MAG TPA: ABC transporter substrate-binding protein [Patescibacteria group bacterium]